MLAPFALIMTAVLMSVGVAVDVGRTVTVKTKLASAADAAVVAGARSLGMGATDTEVKAVAQKYLSAQTSSLQTGVTTGTPTITVDRTSGRVTVQVSANLQMVFGQLMGVTTMTVPVKSSAEIAGKDIELSMVLDVTGSMEGQKLTDLKSAATSVVDAILTSSSSNTKKRIALVPFAASVNAGPLATLVTGGLSLSCVVERGGSNRFTDAAPLNLLNLLGSTLWWNCPSSKVQGLTSDASSLKSQIKALTADGGTAGHIGAAWGWYLVSPNWTSLLSSSTPAAYNPDKTIKAVLLMTDGEFNTFYVQSNGNSSKQAAELCTNMKNAGVVVYTVAFDAPKSADKLLEECATSSANHFSAETGDELIAAFESIAKSLNKLRITE